MTTTLACIVGARPNFVKMAPILRGLGVRAPHIHPILIHTGQHYDEAMSGAFFRQLGLPKPDVQLQTGSGSHGQQTARVLVDYETWLLNANPRPAASLVVGDVNSTLACSLASAKLGIPVFHVEAGLRSFDRKMPEEINRIVTDSIAELLLVSEPSGVENLRREGRPAEAIKLVGNVMIDVLKSQLPAAQALGQAAKMGLTAKEYALWTLHRPSNVDDAAELKAIVEAVGVMAAQMPVVFPVHPRTRKNLETAGLWEALTVLRGLTLTAPLGYLEFLGLTSAAKLIVTDSGGLQEESTALGVPCLTLREDTERPITVTEGTSTLVGHDFAMLEKLTTTVLDGTYKVGHCPALWDGHAGERVAEAIGAYLF